MTKWIFYTGSIVSSTAFTFRKQRYCIWRGFTQAFSGSFCRVLNPLLSATSFSDNFIFINIFEQLNGPSMLSILRIQFKLLNAYTIHLKINNPKPISGWHWRHCPLTKAVFLWSEKSPDNTVDPANLLSDRFNKSRSRVCSSIYCRYVITHTVSGRWLHPCRRRSMAMVNRVFRRGFPLSMSYDSWLRTTALRKEKALQCNCTHVCCFHSDCHPKVHVGKPGSQEGSLKWEVMLAE